MSDVDNYKNLLKRLMPPGRALVVETDSYLSNLLGGIAQELARVHQSANRLLVETDPRTTYDLLTDWERICGLPDECTGIADTLQERQNQVVAKLLTGGTQNKQFFADIAVSLGYDVTVDDVIEFDPFTAGSLAGELLTNSDDWRFAFQVIAPANTIKRFRAGRSLAGERVVVFGDDALECVLNHNKQAHTVVLFDYIEI